MESSGGSREVEDLRARLAAAIERAEHAEMLLDEQTNAHDEAFLQLAAVEVQRSDRLMHAVFEGASDAMLLLDDHGRYVDANPAACALFGVPRSTILRRGVGDFASLPEVSRSLFETVLASGHAGGRITVVRPDAAERTIDFRAVANVAVGVHLCVIRDVTGETLVAESLARSEARLHRADARYRAMVEKSAEAVMLLSREGRVLYSTRHTIDLLGAPPEDVIGTAAIDWVHPEDRTRATAMSDEVLRSGQPLELRLCRRDGEVCWVEAVISIRFDDPAIGAMIANVRDVTSRHAAEEERERLIESLTFERKRLGALLEKAPAFLAVLSGKDHVFEMANEAFSRLVGDWPLLGRPFAEALPALAAQGWVRILTRVFESGQPYSSKSISLNVHEPDRALPERRIINVVVQPIFEADGSHSGVVCHGIDITDEAVAQQRTRAQFNGVPVPTYAWQRVTLRDGSVDFVLYDYNEAANKVTNGQIRSARGRSVREILQWDPEAFVSLSHCIETGQALQREVERPATFDGQTHNLSITFSPAPPDVVLAHVEDVTERRKLEEQLRQAQKMEAVGRLAGGVAHDFNNLLSVVLSYSTLALEDLVPGSPIYGDLEQVKLAAERAVELTKQLLAFSRQQVLQPRIMSVRDTVVGLEKMLRRLLGENVDFVLRLSSQANVLADPGQMELVLMNLVINAGDAMPEGGTLTIEVSDRILLETRTTQPVDTPPGSYVSLAISDTGVGMDAATRARIFEPFFTTKGPGKGTGLGLATVFGIVQQSGGTIHVASEPGDTTFCLYFPQADAAPDAPPLLPKSSIPRRGTETILVVEDEEPLRALAVTVLRREGYQVIEAADGEAARAVAATFGGPIHLLLTDVVMPRMNGRVLADRFALERPDTKVLFMSGYTDDDAVLERVLASRVSFLQKPIRPEQLLRKIRDVLEGSDFIGSKPPPH